MDSEVWDISAFRGCQKTTSAAAIARPALVGECRTPDRLLQVPPRGYRGVGLASKVKTTRLVHGKPTLRGHSVRGDRWPEQRYQSPPAARLDQDHRGGSGKNASGQLSAIPRRRTMRRQNWRFRRELVSAEVSAETPEFKQVFGSQNPHRRTAAHLSAQALPHSMFRAILIAFHALLGIVPSGVAAFGCLTQNLDSLAEPHTLAHSELFLHPTILPCDLLCGHMLR